MRPLLALALLLSSLAFASDNIQSWKNGLGIPFALRAPNGRLISNAELILESWNDSSRTSEWSARQENGAFLAGFKGKLEKFKVSGLNSEQTRLVVSNAQGVMVAWKAIDSRLSAGFEAINTNETAYIIRFEGQIVGRMKARIEKWNGINAPILVVKDGGKLLTWIAGESLFTGEVVFRDPETNLYVNAN